MVDAFLEEGQFAKTCAPYQKAPWQPALALFVALHWADYLPEPAWWRDDIKFFVADYAAHKWFGPTRRGWTKRLQKRGKYGRHIFCALP